MADDDARARRTTRATTAGAAKKAAAKKATAKRAAVKKAASPKKAAPAKKAAPVKKAVSSRTAAAKKAAPAKKAGRGAILAPQPKKRPAMRLAAEQTFDDDWQAPEPEPPRQDPHARIRAVLRAAALEVEGRSPAPTRPMVRPPEPEPPAPDEPDEPRTRVLVAPVPDEDEELEYEDDEADWSPPDLIEEEEVTAVAPPPPPPPPPPPVAEPAPAAPPSPATTFEPPRPAPAPPKKKRRIGRVLLAIVAAAVVAGAAIVAYAALQDEGVDYSELKVGDCFDSSTSNEIRGIDLKPCDEPHNSEIFFLVTHPAGPDDPYPGKDPLVQYAADNCLGQPLTDYLGIPLEQSQLKDFEIVPQESAWDDGRRVLVCGLDTGGQGDVTGSVKGTRR